MPVLLFLACLTPVLAFAAEAREPDPVDAYFRGLQRGLEDGTVRPDPTSTEPPVATEDLWTALKKDLPISIRSESDELSIVFDGPRLARAYQILGSRADDANIGLFRKLRAIRFERKGDRIVLRIRLDDPHYFILKDPETAKQNDIFKIGVPEELEYKVSVKSGVLKMETDAAKTHGLRVGVKRKLGFGVVFTRHIVLLRSLEIDLLGDTGRVVGGAFGNSTEIAFNATYHLNKPKARLKLDVGDLIRHNPHLFLFGPITLGVAAQQARFK